MLAVSPAGLPRMGEKGAAVGVDWRVLAFTLGVSVLTGIVFGLFPALSASRTDLNSTLKESSNRSGTGFRQSKARSLLVVSEVSLALVLLVGSALLIRTFVALRGVDPGFNPHNVLTMDMSLTGERYQKAAGVAQLGTRRAGEAEGDSRRGGCHLYLLPSARGAVWLAVHHCGQAGGEPEGHAGRRMDEHDTGVLQHVQDSHSARARFYGPGHGKLDAGGADQPGAGETILAESESGWAADRDRPWSRTGV